MKKYKLFIELEEIHYKYERLTSLIGLLQQMASEMIEVAGVPEDSLANALYEIELGLADANGRLADVMNRSKGGAE